jgi:hypothetical protein
MSSKSKYLDYDIGRIITSCVCTGMGQWCWRHHQGRSITERTGESAVKNGGGVQCADGDVVPLGWP